MKPTKTLAAKLVDRIYARANSQELTLEQIGQQAIESVVADYDGNRTKAAEFLQVSRSKVVKVLKRVGTAVVVLLLTGCQAYEKQSGEMFLQTVPSEARSREAVQANRKDEGHAIAPAKVLTLLWDKGDEHPDTVTQVWASPEVWSDPPEPMIEAGIGVMIGEFAEPHCLVEANEARAFYIIRNRLGNELSDWARK